MDGFTKILCGEKLNKILMPCNQDLYYRVEDNAIEANHIPKVSLRLYDSPFRHCVANPGYDKGFKLELNKNISELLK